MTTDYMDFLVSKRAVVQPSGLTVASSDIVSNLFPFQREVTRWALWLGKAALFEERGLGKTIQELEWARQVHLHTGGKVIILAPLAVTFQHMEQAAEHGYELHYCQSQADVGDAPVIITNYERLNQFDPSAFVGVVLDESSILKAFNGTTKRAILSAFKNTPYKLAASATPAPNDHLELGNHAEFLDVMPSNEMIARWFINDTMKSGNYRLKGHAAKDFWRWLTSWAVCLSHPRDLGPEYDMPGYDLPPLHLHEHRVDVSQATIARTFAEGRLLPDGKPSSTELHRVKSESLNARVEKARQIVSALNDDEPVIFWCDTNDEADALIKAFPGVIEVRGSHTAKRKESNLRAFTAGEFKRIITKPDIAGMGLNWQHCNQMIFTGVTYSFEKMYQAWGRCHRYGQTREVNAHIIFSDTEGNVVETLQRKQSDFVEMQAEMNEAMRIYGLFRDNNQRGLKTSVGRVPMLLPDWAQEKEVHHAVN